MLDDARTLLDAAGGVGDMGHAEPGPTRPTPRRERRPPDGASVAEDYPEALSDHAKAEVLALSPRAVHYFDVGRRTLMFGTVPAGSA